MIQLLKWFYQFRRYINKVGPIICPDYPYISPVSYEPSKAQVTDLHYDLALLLLTMRWHVIIFTLFYNMEFW